MQVLTLLGTLVTIIQNDSVSFSFLQITYLGITQAACSITSTFGFWYIQRYFKFKTKTMFLFTNFFSVLIPFWGMLGLWTKHIGYHNRVCIMFLRQQPFIANGNAVGILFLQCHFWPLSSSILRSKSIHVFHLQYNISPRASTPKQ